MMNRTAEKPSTSPQHDMNDNNGDDVLDSDSDDEQEDKLKSIHAFRGGGGKTAANNDAKKDKTENDDEDEEDEDDDKVLEQLHINPSLRRYDEFSSFLTRSERAHEKPDVPPSEEALARRRVIILLDQQRDQQQQQQQQPKSSSSDEHHTTTLVSGPGITVYEDENEPMTSAELKEYFMQPEDFRRCDADVDMTIIRWNKAQKGQYKWDDNENTIRGLEDEVTSPVATKKKGFRKSKKNTKTTTSTPKATRSDFRYDHSQIVLAEVVRQKMQNGSGGIVPYNNEKIRMVSLHITESVAQQARVLGQQDENDVINMNSGLRWKKAATNTINMNNAVSNNKGGGGKKINITTTTATKDKGKGFFSFLQRNNSKKL